MHELDDIALLREFAERGSEPAFAELVTRHVNKVYSVALRYTRNPHQAEEITQDVFVILARKAAQLGKNVILSGWLYQTARLTAVTLIRSEIRRARREQKVLMQTNETEADPWPHIAPLLDDAMAGLSETDRHAVVLRYFDGKSMKEVGAALGGSEDAAKMRVNRAVEKLRTFFAKRGVALPAATLTTVIAAHSVQAAPVGLASAVTTAALSGATITTSAIIAATKTIAMTTLQKTLVTVTVAVLAGAGIYEARQAAQLREQNQTLQQSQAPLAEQNQQLQRERDEATNRLADLRDELAKGKSNNLELLKLRGEVGRLKVAANSEEVQNAEHVVQNINLLKNYFSQNPTARTPELQFLDKLDWVTRAVSSDIGVGGADQEKAFRQDASKLRNLADKVAGTMFRDAIGKYEENNNGQFPSDLSQLKPYLERSKNRPDSDAAIENVDAILDRWKIVPAEQVKGLVMGGDMVITQKVPVDDLLDERIVVGNQVGSRSFVDTDTWDVLQPVRTAYRAAHGGILPPDDSQLQSYVTTPEQSAAFQKLIQSERWTVNAPK